MNKTLVLLLAALLVFSLCACGKSEKAAAMEAQITALGEITLSSEAAIADAEKAFHNLTQDDREQVENYDALKEARSTYEQLVLQDAAEQIDQEILKIENMTSGKPEAVKTAEELYDKAALEIQSLVKHKDQLDTYLQNMDDLKAEDARSLISSIGDITLESKDKIIAAKKAFYSLPMELKEKAGSDEALIKASEAFIGLCQSTVNEIISQMRCVDGDYFPEELPWMDETTLSLTEGCFFTAYLVPQNNGMTPHILTNYTGDNWVFFNQVIITTGKKQYTLAVNPFNVKRDESRENIWEQMDIAAGDSDIEMLRAILAAEKTVITFKGYKYEADYTVSEADKKGISDVLKVYDCMDASYEINHPGA